MKDIGIFHGPILDPIEIKREQAEADNFLFQPDLIILDQVEKLASTDLHLVQTKQLILMDKLQDLRLIAF